MKSKDAQGSVLNAVWVKLLSEASFKVIVALVALAVPVYYWGRDWVARGIDLVQTPYPAWAIGAGIVCGVGLLVLAGLLLVARQPSSADYRKDYFEGVDWRWQTRSSMFGPAYDLFAFCPFDDTQLVTDYDYSPRREFHTCETCGRQFPIAGYREKQIERVTRQIHRKLRTGEWQQVSNNQNKKESRRVITGGMG